MRYLSRWLNVQKTTRVQHFVTKNTPNKTEIIKQIQFRFVCAQIFDQNWLQNHKKRNFDNFKKFLNANNTQPKVRSPQIYEVFWTFWFEAKWMAHALLNLPQLNFDNQHWNIRL